jgi:hypothetical protein
MKGRGLEGEFGGVGGGTGHVVDEVGSDLLFL